MSAVEGKAVNVDFVLRTISQLHVSKEAAETLQWSIETQCRYDDRASTTSPEVIESCGLRPCW